MVAERRSFRSIGEAMTCCRKVLDGTIRRPRWESDGEILQPHTDPLWNEGKVRVVDDYSGDPLAVYYTSSGRRNWHEMDENEDRWSDEVARTDWDAPS